MAGDAYHYELFIETRIGKSRSETLAEDEPAPVQGAGDYIGDSEGHDLAGQSGDLQLCKGKFRCVESRFRSRVFSNRPMREDLGVPIPTAICK